MLKSPLRSGRNANEDTVTENRKKKDIIRNVKNNALSPAENGIPEDDLKRMKGKLR